MINSSCDAGIATSDDTQHKATASTTARIGVSTISRVLTRGKRGDAARDDAQSDDGQEENCRERNRHQSDPAGEANHLGYSVPVCVIWPR